MAAFGFPIASGIKLMIGCAVAGFFLSLDTVRNGGRFDGVAGVVAGLEIATVLEEMQIDKFR